MLEKEDDASKRALLLVLSSLNANLMANTAATESIRKDLTAHLSSYQVHMEVTTEYINKGKGAWKVFAWVLGIAQTLLVLGMDSVHTDMKAYTSAITALQIMDATLGGRIEDLKAKVK
jgi:hypothetical protein